MRVLVTGGAGFIGSEVARSAAAAGWQVRVLDSLREDVHGSPSPPPGVDFLRGDVRDPHILSAALHEVDVVAHQAAKVGLGVDIDDAPDYVGSNDLGTAVLLAAMARSGVRRLVLASSMVVYGEGAYRGAAGPVRPAPRRARDLDAGRFDPLDAEGRPLTPAMVREDDLLDPRSVYAASKLAQEHLTAAWAHATGGTAIALRYHNVYGPGMPQNTPYAGVASLFRSAIERGEAPRVFEDGAQRRDFVHVRDIAGANVAALEATGSPAAQPFRAYNVGSGEVHTIGDLASALSRHSAGPAPIVTGRYRIGDVRHITASSDRIRAELGWTPTVGFDEGMREFAASPLRAAVR
ncbi:NAD-dependent epimerase/dehydratase family protein [Protaetiibacter mangrovi]|uniref:NAD-dependent epimerase/dehydratase family protein n=1 Tax=Protaetiibacter mangrovi TaxID=2970926 RepID=A0ABT1ZC93_9MICO|nr:NAD-dependent epimerase/dehydratase family protein [Protaetiibacter mangrovi]MCS0498325.1 NAD-dependent epimerase/dehydratase family protein [Protaetiibacter mangrovi]TPX02379.1 NAD-dependent epimerase/dehydratase family protein [Schumannella luteola]